MDKVKLDFSRELRNQELISDIIKNDPYPIARLMEVFVEIYDKKEPDRAFREMIKLFASTFKYTGLIIISDYLSLLRQNKLPDAKLTKMIDNFLYVNLKGMSMGHWQFCLREITRLAMHNDIKLFVPELISLYWKNQKKLSNVAKWIDNKMIPLRNDYVHSDIWLDSETADKMIQEYFPNLIAYINEIKFFRNYPLLHEENRFYIENENKEKLTLEYFIIYSQKDEWSKEEMLLYETLKGKSIKYLLGNFYNFESEYIDNIKAVGAILKERLSEFESVGEKVDTTNEIVGKLEEHIISGTQTLQTAYKGLTGNDQITQQIKQTVVDLKNAMDNFESVKSHLKLLKAQMQHQKDDDWHRYQTASILNLYREIFDSNGGKFDLKEFESLFIDRYEIHQHYNKFISKKETGLSFILAESGSGKTTFCQKIAIDYFKKVNQQVRDTADILFYLKGSGITASDAYNSFLSTFSYPGNKLEDMFLKLANSDKPQNGNYIIMIDGINESDNPNELLKFIVNFAKKNRSNFLKILVTCRVVMWDTIAKGIDFPFDIIYPDIAESSGQDEVPFVRLSQFNNIDVERAYDKYAANRFIKTRFYNLSPFIRETCKDPFLLNILTEAYRGTYKKRSVIKPNSLSTIYEKYIFSTDPKKLTRPTDRNPSPKDMQIIHQLLELMWKHGTDSVPEEFVRQDELLTEAIYEPNPVVEKGDAIQCADMFCHWRWLPDEQVDFPFLCPNCGQNTLIWQKLDEAEMLVCENENCSWKWLPDKNKEIRFKCPNGHALKWSSADYRTPYNRLLDEGILSEIVREDGAFLVRFKYDRIFEYLMAREYLLSGNIQQRQLDEDTIRKWIDGLKKANINPIFFEAVATAISLASNNIQICQLLLEQDNEQKYYCIITAILKKIAIADENGLEHVLDFVKNLIRKKLCINEIVIPVIYHLRRDGLQIIEMMTNNKNTKLNKAGSELLFRISSTNIEDGLYIINAILSNIKPTNIIRRSQSISILLEICLKICTMAEPEVVLTIMNIWAKLFRNILGYGKKNPALHLIRYFLKSVLMTAGSGFIVHKFRQIKIGKTDLHHIFFTKSQTKEILLTLSDFMTPQPERISEIKDILLNSLVVSEDDEDGMAFVGLFSILILNILLRYDETNEVISVCEYLFEEGDIYTRWVICSALNYSLQESYFSSRETKLKPLEKNEEVVKRYRDVMKRFIDEERDGYVQDYIKVGDYFFPLGIICQFSFATETNNDLIWEIINKSIAEEDFLVLRKLLLDITCFSLDTFCYQRRFWEKTYDILTDLILLLYPMSNENMVFADKRQELDRSIIEALAILHYAHPEETDIMLTNLANSYNTAVNKASIDFVAQLNRESKAAIYNKFQVLRSNIIQMDKKDNPIEIKDITQFVDGFLTGWIYADFASAIFGRYPAFRNIAKFWIKEPLADQYEKKPKKFFKKLFREIFASLERFQPEIPELE